MAINRIIREIEREAAEDGSAFELEITFSTGFAARYDFLKCHSGFLELQQHREVKEPQTVYVPFESILAVVPIWL